MPSRKRILWVALLTALLAGCAAPTPALQASATRPAALTPYHTATATRTPPPPPAGTPTPLPSPTATPRTHVVAPGEDMGGIAFRYGIPLNALIAANPNVNPNAMSVGTSLVVPASSAPAKTGLPAPTALPIPLQPVRCAPSQEGGLWCFVLARNNHKEWVENLSAVVRVADAKGGHMISQTALPPLDLLPPGASLPLAAYFPPPVPQPFQASAELLGALPLAKIGSRYLQVSVEDQQVQIAQDGLSARTTGQVVLKDPKKAPGLVWVAAAAYDRDGNPVGVRRWEIKDPPASGGRIPFNFAVYSTGPAIARVELLAEARP